MEKLFSLLQLMKNKFWELFLEGVLNTRSYIWIKRIKQYNNGKLNWY